MKSLIYLLAVAWGPLCYGIGAYLGSRNRQPRSEKRELNAQRELLNDLIVSAAEHTMLQDPFAVLALDAITQHRKALSR